MKFNIATVAAALPAVASALAINPVSSSSNALLATRQDFNWEQYEMETDELKHRALCRHYGDGDAPGEAVHGADMCEDFCGPVREMLEPDTVFSVTCLVDSQVVDSQPDPSGARYKFGECQCNNPVVNWFVNEIVVEGLPKVGQAACAVWKKAALEAKDYLVVAAKGPFAGTTQILSKAAKALAKTGAGVSEWEDWVRERVEDDTACDFSPQQLFEDLTGFSEEDIKNVL